MEVSGKHIDHVRHADPGGGGGARRAGRRAARGSARSADELFLSEDEAGPEALADAVESGAVVFDGPAFEDDLGALVPSPDERAADRRKAARKAQRKARKAGDAAERPGRRAPAVVVSPGSAP